mmetsp:Transcript_53630/g.104861  ORF Transcript_53630/g.104861 Transcript_53630/m.104861 type:complete len:291 (-) Transcript_53630:245-1117(-)
MGTSKNAGKRTTDRERNERTNGNHENRSQTNEQKKRREGNFSRLQTMNEAERKSSLPPFQNIHLHFPALRALSLPTEGKPDGAQSSTTAPPPSLSPTHSLVIFVIIITPPCLGCLPLTQKLIVMGLGSHPDSKRVFNEVVLHDPMGSSLPPPPVQIVPHRVCVLAPVPLLLGLYPLYRVPLRLHPELESVHEQKVDEHQHREEGREANHHRVLTQPGPEPTLVTRKVALVHGVEHTDGHEPPAFPRVPVLVSPLVESVFLQGTVRVPLLRRRRGVVHHVGGHADDSTCLH